MNSYTMLEQKRTFISDSEGRNHNIKGIYRIWNLQYLKKNHNQSIKITSKLQKDVSTYITKD